jgi:hypothetical protein
MMKIVEIWTSQTVCDSKIIPALIISTEWRGIFFIQTGGVLAGSAGYIFNLAGYGRDIGGVSQVLGT